MDCLSQLQHCVKIIISVKTNEVQKFQSRFYWDGFISRQPTPPVPSSVDLSLTHCFKTLHLRNKTNYQVIKHISIILRKLHTQIFPPPLFAFGRVYDSRNPWFQTVKLSGYNPPLYCSKLPKSLTKTSFQEPANHSYINKHDLNNRCTGVRWLQCTVLEFKLVTMVTP